MTLEEFKMVEKRLPAFQDLRIVPWQPYFHNVRTVNEAANDINLPHEDYPNRVSMTQQAIVSLLNHYPNVESLKYAFTNQNLLSLHQLIFGDTHHSGNWRNVKVQVVRYVPPNPDMIPKLMEQLESIYDGQITNIERLTHWYSDFETIHPFQDGNGRVGGVMLAFASHRLNPAQGFLAPGQ